MRTRHIFLSIIVVLVVIILGLAIQTEGLTAAQKGECGKTLTAYSGGNYGDGVKPPLDPKKCAGKTMGRMKKCYKSEGGEWKPKSGDCASWISYVTWNDKIVRAKTAKSPFQRPSKYKKYQNTGFTGTDSVGSKQSVKNAKECAATCNATTGCAGISMAKTKVSDKYDCWMVPEARTKTRTNDKGWNAFVKNAFDTAGTPAAATTGNTAGILSACQDVTVYENENYGGDNPVKLGCQSYEGEKLPFVYKAKDRVMSRLTSLNIPAGMKVYAESPDGGNHMFWGNQRNVGKNWNDQITKLVPQLCDATDIVGGCGVYQEPPRII